MTKPEIEERLGAEITRLLGECDRLQRTLSTICIERPLTVSYQNAVKERDEAFKDRCDLDVVRIKLSDQLAAYEAMQCKPAAVFQIAGRIMAAVDDGRADFLRGLSEEEACVPASFLREFGPLVDAARADRAAGGPSVGSNTPGFSREEIIERIATWLHSQGEVTEEVAKKIREGAWR